MSLKEYARQWREANRDRTREHNKKHYHEFGKKKASRRRYWLNKYMVAKGCVYCGYNKSGLALDWDHLVPEDKHFNVGARIARGSLKTIFKEIRKCQVACANCHRVKSFGNIEKYIERIEG